MKGSCYLIISIFMSLPFATHAKRSFKDLRIKHSKEVISKIEQAKEKKAIRQLALAEEKAKIHRQQIIKDAQILESIKSKMSKEDPASERALANPMKLGLKSGRLRYTTDY